MNKYLKFAAWASAFFAIVLAIGYYLGMSDAIKVQERLRPLWPDIEVMSPLDRALLGYLAKECDLMKRVDAHSETLACLRSVAIVDQSKQGNVDPKERLEILIDRATPAQN